MKGLAVFSALLFSALSSVAQTSASIDIGGVTRTYTYFVPLTMPPQAPALVFVLHGATQDGETIMDISSFNEVANGNNFIVVYPDGIGNSWNVGLTAGGSTADDIAFIEALVNHFMTDFSIDEHRVYSCGFSAGGYMSHRLACESSVCFAAIASVAGAISEEALSNCAPQYTPSIMQIHGTSDLVVSYNGSVISGISVDEIISTWLSNNNCPSTAEVEALPNISVLDFSTVERFTYAPCNEDSEVQLLKITGGGHQWPGTDALLGGIGNINQDIDASIEIWNFFNQFQCPSEVSTLEIIEETSLSIFPNPASDMVNIQYEQGLQPEVLVIYNAQGQVVFHQKWNKGQTTLQISVDDFAPGIYFIQNSNQRLVVIQ
ncbi:MAG: T9SS type A sorting domain-containing protein [Flavobacteriales bacterium]